MRRCLITCSGCPLSMFQIEKDSPEMLSHAEILVAPVKRGSVSLERVQYSQTPKNTSLSPD